MYNLLRVSRKEMENVISLFRMVPCSVLSLRTSVGAVEGIVKDNKVKLYTSEHS